MCAKNKQKIRNKKAFSSCLDTPWEQHQETPTLNGTKMSINRRSSSNVKTVALCFGMVILGFAGIQFSILRREMSSDQFSAKYDSHHHLQNEDEVKHIKSGAMKDVIRDTMREPMVEAKEDSSKNKGTPDNSIGDEDDDEDDEDEAEAPKKEEIKKARERYYDDDGGSTKPKGQDESNANLRKKESKLNTQSDNSEPEVKVKTKKLNSGMNIVLLYADDWRFDSLGIVNPIVHTPNLDKLASNGMLFSQNAVTTSICWISRACLSTGQHYARHKTINIGGPVPFYEHWNDTLYAKLKNNGYFTGMVGKWHLASFPPDSFHYHNLYYGFHIDRNGKHITDMNEDHALEFLRLAEKAKDDPFALFVNFYAPHHHDGQPEQYFPSNATMSLYNNITIPFAPTATQEAWEALPSFFNDNNEGRIRWRLRFDTPEKAQKMIKNYFRLISGVDKTCGKIIEELERKNLMNNTMIIFTTDNGYYHAEHGLADKFYFHQESVRVPLIIHDPRMPKEKIGTQNDDLTLSIDLAPTMLSAAGVDVPVRMQGVDMSPLYRHREKPSWRDQYYYEFPGIPHNAALVRVQALIRKDYKYVFWIDEDYEQLYHIPTDRYEEHDLARNFTYKEKLEELREIFKTEQRAAQ